MSPISELPTGEGGDTSTALFPQVPFGPEDSYAPVENPDLETRKALPYTEDNYIPYADETAGISFSIPDKKENIINTAPLGQQFKTPDVVDQPAFEETLLKQWKATEEQAKYDDWAAENRPKAARLGLEVMAATGIPGVTPAIAALDLLQKEDNRKALEQKYSWLGNEPLPTWQDYKERQYGQKWDTFSLEDQRKGFEHWAQSSAEYWVGLKGMDDKVYQTAYQQAVAGGLASQFTDFTNKQIKEDSTWLDSNFSSTYSFMFDEGVVDESNRGKSSKQSVFSKAFDAKKADLLAGKTNEEMRSMLEAKQFVASLAGLDENGKVSKEKLAEARRSVEEEYNFEISDPGVTEQETTKARRRYDDAIGKINRLDSLDNPEAEITKLNEGYQRFRRISQNMKVLQSPSIKEMLGAPTATDFWKSFTAHPADNMGYFGGEMVAQYLEMVPAIATGIVASAEAGPAAPAVVAGAAGAASGRQEYLAIIPDLMEQEMQKRGLDSSKEESWQTVMSDETFYNDVKNQAARKGIVTAAYEGALYALFGHMIKLVKPASSPKIGFLARRALDIPAGVVAAGAGEIQGQFAQNPEKETDWLAVSQEIAAEWPGQTQQAAMESMSSVYGRFFNKGQAPTQTPTDAGATPPSAGSGDISLESIQRELGAEIPKASPEVSKENGPQANATDGNVAPSGGQDLATTIDSATGVVKEGEVRPAKDAAEFFSSLPAAKDAFESAQAIIKAAEEPATPAVEAADVFQQAERQRQSLEGLASLNQHLRRLEFYSNLAPAPVVELSIPQTSAEKSAQAIENQLGSEEQFRQSPEGRAALGSELKMFDTPDQPFTEGELNQLELNGLLSPEEKKQYIEFLTKKSVDNSRLAFNAGLAGRLIDRVVAEDRIRQSFGGMEALRNQYSELEKADANLSKKIAESIGQESYGTQQKGKGMSVQENNRRNQGGFVDLDAVFSGVREAAVSAWSKTKDFVSWAAEMTSVYGDKIKGSLSKIWNALILALSKTKDFLTYTGNKERGTIDLRQPRTDNRPSAGGPFKYSLSPYDETNNKIGKYPIAKSGIIPESEFISINKDPVQLKRSEFEFYKTIVPEAFKDGMVDVKKLYEGLRDNGPVVKVTKYGNLVDDEQEQTQDEKHRDAVFNSMAGIQHNYVDNLSEEDQRTFEAITNKVEWEARSTFVEKHRNLPFSNSDIKEAQDLADKELDKFLEQNADGNILNDSDFRQMLRLNINLTIEYSALSRRAPIKKSESLKPTQYYDQISPLETSSHPVIRIDLTIPQTAPKNLREYRADYGHIIGEESNGPVSGIENLWNQDNLHENIPNTFGWAMVQPTVNPLTGKPAWLIAELQSRWAQSVRDGSSNGELNHPLLATHQKAVINAVIDEARKAGIDSIIVSDAETAMMTEMHDRHTIVPNGTYTLPSGETYVIADNAITYYQDGENTDNSAGKQIQAYNREYLGLKEAVARGEVPSVVKQEKGMRMAYDVTLPSIAKEVTGRVGIPVDLGSHKNSQSVYTYEGDYKGEGSNYFKNKDGTPKSNITGLSYDITEAGPRAAMLFADVFGVKLVADSVRIAFRGAKELAGFTSQIVQELGKWIEPYAQKLWETMKNAPQKLEEVISEIAAAEAPRKTGRILAKTMKAIFNDLPAKSPLRAPFESISWEFLPYTERRDLMRLAKDYFKAKQGKGPIVKQELLQRALEMAAKSSYTKGFNKLKSQNPISLAGKSESDFSSIKDVRGYIASLDNAEAEKLRVRHKARAKAPETRKTNRAKEAEDAFASAKMEVTNGIAKEMVSKLSPMMRVQAEKALEIIGRIDPSKLTDSEKEHITAAVQNVADGNWIGVGAILARAEASEAIVLGNAIRKKIGGFLSLPLTGAIGSAVDALSSGSLPQAFSRHDVRERISFVTPVAKEWWSRYIAKYAADGMRVAKTMQLENTAEIERIIKKWGFSHSLFGGIANHTKTLSAKRTGLAALLTQYREGNTAMADINNSLRDVMRGIQAMQTDKSSVYQAIGQIEGSLLKDFLIKAGKAGMLAQDEDGQLQINVEPEVWSSFIFSQLDKNEQGALNDIRNFAGRYTNDIGFVQEFVYGKEWQPWNNYVMRQAMTLDGTEAVSPEGMALDASTMANSEFATPVGKTQSILNPRVGLAKGQFYNLDIFHTALHGMNQAAYEVGTAQARMELKALFEDPLSDGLWDSAVDKKLTYKIYKDVHQKSLGIETGTSIQGTPGQQITAWALIRPMDAWVGLVMNSASQVIKQASSPLLAYILTDGALSHFFNSIGHFYNSDVWNEKGREEFLSKATPDLLIRLKTYDPAFDDLVGSGIVEEIRRIAKDRNFVPLTVEQKRLKRLGRIMNFADPVASVPISISRYLNTKPDQIAASRIFLSEYSRFLIKKGVIKDISEFTPSLPFDNDAANHADQVVTEILGGASSREKRPNVLSYVKSVGAAGRIPAIAARRMFMNLSGINTQIASDSFRSIGEATYNNPKDPVGSKAVRQQANLRIRRNIIQMGTFIAAGYVLAWGIQNALIFGMGSSTGLDDWEGLDEEEKKILERIERARYEAQKGFIGLDKAIQDIGMMLTGGLTHNSGGQYLADKTSSTIFQAFFEEDYKENIAAMEKQLKSTSDKDEKLKIQQNIDIAKTIKAQMDYRARLNLDFGQVDAYGDMSNFVLKNKSVDNGEADRIAMEYWNQTKGKKGAMQEEPTKSGFQKTTRAMVDNVLRIASTDIGRAQDKVNKARAIVLAKRKRELESAAKAGRDAKPIDTNFGSLKQ